MEKRKEKIAEGKTKIIWGTPIEGEVLIENKPVLTKGDGAERVLLKGKDVLATETTCNCFNLLNKTGVPTHFIERVDERTFRALWVRMIPIELVARRIATGSYLKRTPKVIEGTVFKNLVVEFFLKDDARHDPMMIWAFFNKECFWLYDAKKPISEGYLGDLPSYFPLVPRTAAEVQRFSEMVQRVFLILEEAWERQRVALVDLKIECGYTDDGRLVVADVIDNDSWRIWPAGDKTQMKDKEVYRQLTAITSESRETLKNNYTWVAEATKKFLTL